MPTTGTLDDIQGATSCVTGRATQHSTLDKPVLIAGASRNGQEEAARCIHQLSERASQGLIEIDCDGARVDLVQAAFGRASQAVGALDTIWVKGLDKAPSDVMTVVSHAMQRRGVVVSVHRSLKDLQLAAREGELREDLLSVFNMGIELPPLGRRLGDVPLLVYYVIARHNRGDFGSPRQAIETVTVQSLYVVSRCLNVSQLEWTVKEGCRRAPAECLDLDVSELEDREMAALSSEVESADKILLKDEELLRYDLDGLLRYVDEAAEREILNPTGGRRKVDGVDEVEGTSKISELVPRNEEEAELESDSVPSVFRQEGKHWTVVYKGEKLPPLIDSPGLTYLHLVLSRPNEEINVFELISLRKKHDFYITSEEQIAEGLSASQSLSGGTVSKPRAVKEVQDALEEVNARLDSGLNADELESAIEAKDMYEKYLKSSIGLGGRLRSSGDEINRARASVRMAINRSREKLASYNERLGQHLKDHVHTGTRCSYTPEEPSPAWEV